MTTRLPQETKEVGTVAKVEATGHHRGDLGRETELPEKAID